MSTPAGKHFFIIEVSAAFPKQPPQLCGSPRLEAAERQWDGDVKPSMQHCIEGALKAAGPTADHTHSQLRVPETSS